MDAPAPSAEDADEEPTAANYWGLALPDTRHQPRVDLKTLKELRARCNNLAKDKQLVYVTVSVHSHPGQRIGSVNSTQHP